MGEREIGVWCAEVPHSAAQIEALAAALPPEDRSRADRIRGADARARYLTGRTALRTVLGELLETAPAALRFQRLDLSARRGAHGKPALAPGEFSGIDFNLAHSGRLALLAVGRGCRVGVDVERVRTRLDVAGVARWALSPAEFAEIEAIRGTAERRAAFFRCWTRKEAYLKARADGLPGRLREWSVPVGLATVVVPSVPAEPGQARTWRIHLLALGKGYTGALAHDGDTEPICAGLRIEPIAAA